MKNATYFVCYDTHGNGFEIGDPIYSFAFNEEELEEVICQLMEDELLDDDQICIFKLTGKTVNTKWNKSLTKVKKLTIK